MWTLYGIPQCDSVKKARRALDARGAGYHFHDLRQAPVDAERLRQWIGAVGASVLLNRASTTWRGLSEEARTVTDDEAVLRLLLAHPTLIKRPVLTKDNVIHVGFDPARYASID